MIHRLFGGLTAALIAALLLVLPAAASVTFDPATGSGFVGKGDVQSAFGWNNPQLQANASSVTFSYIVTGTLTQTCEREAGHSQVITRAFTRTLDVQASILSSGRNISSGLNGPNTGFGLSGFVSGAAGLAVPTDICPNSNPNPAENVWHPVSPAALEGGSAGALYVTFGGTAVRIW
jgi:hypothetical protein